MELALEQPHRWYVIHRLGIPLALVATAADTPIGLAIDEAQKYGAGAAASAIFLRLGISRIPPTKEQIDAAIAPPPAPHGAAIVESFDIDAMDATKNGTITEAYPFASDYGPRWNGFGFTREFVK
jgi:hypothetical protein